jgi:hypothetical protein
MAMGPSGTPWGPMPGLSVQAGCRQQASASRNVQSNQCFNILGNFEHFNKNDWGILVPRIKVEKIINLGFVFE